MKGIVIVPIFFMVIHSVVGIYLYDHVGTLVDDLMQGYKPNVLPIQNYSSVVKVELFLTVFAIRDVDHIKGTVQMQVSSRVRWTDERMTWRPELYGGINSVLIEKENVWKPSIVVPTTVDYATVTGPEKNILYNHHGTALWLPDKLLENACTFYMRYWPFDKQKCRMFVSVSDYTVPNVILKSLGTGVNTDYVDMTEWALDEVTIQEGVFENTTFILYNFKLLRNYTFYFLTTILPITFIAWLQPFVFILPCSSGERTGFSITIVLALAVFFTVISDQIPRTGEPMALICGYIMLLTVSSVAMTIAVILNLKIYHMSDSKPVPRWLLALYQIVSCNQDKKRETRDGVAEKDVALKCLPPPDERTNGQTEITVNASDVEHDENEEELSTSWSDASQALDKILFIVSIVATVPSSVIFLTYLYSASEYNPEPIGV
ncbi:Neuronal acetylcholine receptor subunit beta-3 [Mactra antiquata]